MTFWNRFEKALEDNNITASELSRNLGLASSVIYAWKQRDSIPRADIAVKVAEQLHTTVEYLVSGTEKINVNQKSQNSFFVPILNQELSATNGLIPEENDVIKGLISIPPNLRCYGRNLAGLYVHGDSMEPTLYNDDLVICTSLGWDNEEGLYAVKFNGKAYVKRIQVAAGKIIIKSDNPKYESISEPSESENFVRMEGHHQ